MIRVTKTLCMFYPLRRAVFGCLIQPINTMRALQCAAFHLSAAVGTDHSRTSSFQRAMQASPPCADAPPRLRLRLSRQERG